MGNWVKKKSFLFCFVFVLFSGSTGTSMYKFVKVLPHPTVEVFVCQHILNLPTAILSLDDAFY